MLHNRAFPRDIRQHIPLAVERMGLFYGWVIVAVSFLTIALVFGVRLSFGLFFDELIRSGEFAWARGNTAGVFSISMFVFAATSAPVGWLLDRLGPRRVFSLGLAMTAVGLFLTSQMHSLLQFYLFYGVWTGVGISALGLTIFAATLSRWFDQGGRRGLAIGVAFSGTGVGILVLAPILEWVITAYGWRRAYMLLMILIGGVALPLVWFFMWDSPRHLGLAPEGSRKPARAPDSSSPAAPSSRAWTWTQATRTLSFWFLMASGLLSLFTLRMVTVHQVAYLVDHGVPRLVAATVTGAAGLVTALSFVIFGGISDKIGRDRAFYLGGTAQLIALGLLLLVWQGVPIPYLLAYVVFWGLGEGSRSNLLTAIVSDTFPGPAVGAIVGTMGTFFALGAGLGSWLGGAVYDWTHSYRPAFFLALMATLGAMGGIYLARRHIEAHR